MSTQPVVAPKAAGTEDFMPLHGIDHVELYVGNAVQSAYFYVHALGFRDHAPGDRRLRPVHPVVVVAEDADRRHPPVRQVSEHAPKLLVLRLATRLPMSQEVTRDDDDVRVARRGLRDPRPAGRRRRGLDAVPPRRLRSGRRGLPAQPGRLGRIREAPADDLVEAQVAHRVLGAAA